MKFFNLLVIISCTLFYTSCQQNTDSKTGGNNLEQSPKFAIAIHGGAGTILKQNMLPETEQAYRSTLDSALTIGEKILSEEGTSTEAVIAVIKFMEDSPLFNAGKGAVFNAKGENELDASIMDGKTQNAGAISGVRNIKHPIEAAYAVMNQSEHVLLSGAGAESFALSVGLDTIDPSYFFTQRRYDALLKVQETEKTGSIPSNPDYKYGTVGCVAMDINGDLAAGTSTGGMTNKRFNRVGDSPIIGAGTYADNNSVAVSCTGHGEYFIRYAVAYDIAARMTYGKVSLKTACEDLVNEKLVQKGGSGGLIALDKSGNIEMPFNTEGMYRASSVGGKRFIGIYKDE